MEREREDPSFGVAQLDGGGDTVPRAPPRPCYNRESKRTAFEIGSARYFSSRGPGCGPWHEGKGWREEGGGERAKAPSSQLQFVFALKRNITWWDRVEDSADASCVVRCITPSRTVSRTVRYRFDWRQHSKGVPLKSRLPP